MRRQIMIAAIALHSLECSVNSSQRNDAPTSLTPPTETRSGEVGRRSIDPRQVAGGG
jgi:hypothetical protein